LVDALRGPATAYTGAQEGRVESLGDNDVSALPLEIEVLAVNEALDKLGAE
jgi:hypothetical protein